MNALGLKLFGFFIFLAPMVIVGAIFALSLATIVVARFFEKKEQFFAIAAIAFFAVMVSVVPYLLYWIWQSL